MTTAAEFIAGFEGFSKRAYWDVNAYRLGYGSDTEGPEQTRVTEGMETTKERALQNLSARIPQFAHDAILRPRRDGGRCLEKTIRKPENRAPVARLQLWAASRHCRPERSAKDGRGHRATTIRQRRREQKASIRDATVGSLGMKMLTTPSACVMIPRCAGSSAAKQLRIRRARCLVCVITTTLTTHLPSCAYSRSSLWLGLVVRSVFRLWKPE
jgi:hypothetical protein